METNFEKIVNMVEECIEEEKLLIVHVDEEDRNIFRNAFLPCTCSKYGNDSFYIGGDRCEFNLPIYDSTFEYDDYEDMFRVENNGLTYYIGIA